MQKTDIVPDLKKRIENTYRGLIENDESLKRLTEKIHEAGTWEDAQEYAGIIGNHRSTSFLENISSDDLPDGQMYYNIANRIIPPALESDYEQVSEVCMEVQEQANEAARIGIKAQKADLNRDRIDGIVNRISSELFKNVRFLLGAPIVNFARSIPDDTVEKNADFQYEAGLKPVIRRTTDGKCCEWCTKLAGDHPYSLSMDRDVFRRHENCGCTVAYYPDAKAKRGENVHDKQAVDSSSQTQRQNESANSNAGSSGGNGTGGNGGKNGKSKKKPKTGSKNHKENWTHEQDLDELIERICPNAIVKETPTKILYYSQDGEFLIVADKTEGYHRVRRLDPSSGKFRYVDINLQFAEQDKGDEFERRTHFRNKKN